METIKAKEIERVALQDRVRLLGADNVAILHPRNPPCRCGKKWWVTLR